MPLVTGADFGLTAPPVQRQGVSPILRALEGLGAQRRHDEMVKKQEEQLLQQQQAEKLKRSMEVTSLRFLDIAKLPTFTEKRTALLRMAKDAKVKGNDTQIFNDLLAYGDNDSLDTGILRFAQQAGDTGKRLDERLKAQKPVEQFEAIYQNGEVVAQRSTSSNKVISDPRAKSSLAKGAGGKFFQPITLVNPATKEKRLVLPVGDPSTQTAKLADIDIPEGFEISTETPEEKRNANVLADKTKKVNELEAEQLIKPRTKRQVLLAEQAVKKADKAFTQIDKIKTNVTNLNDALTAVKAGAGTGPVDRLLPSFRAASVALDAAQGRLGLDVVQATTFGALSKGELDLSKAIALPTGLQGDELIEWIDDKIESQQNVASYLERQAIFLSETNPDGDPNTVADWVKKEKEIFTQAMEGITEADILETMRANDMDRSEVEARIRRDFENGGS